MAAELISIVIPCYNSENTLESVINEVDNVFEEKLVQYEHEYIFVNDCSNDGTMEVIKKICSLKSNVTGIDLAKNFGQHAALLAGFGHVNGDYVVCLDDDGQMPIESVPDMIEMLSGDTDVVQGRYSKTKQSAFRKFGSFINSKMAEILLSKPKELEMNSFWGAKRFVTDEMIKYEGSYPYIAGLILRTTSNIKNLDVVHRKRINGNSGYSLISLFKLWMNGFTAFSEKPLRFASLCGIICAFLGFVFAVYTVIKKILNPAVLIGYSSLICVILFIGGMIMMMLGIIGEYIGRSYISLNRSPQYVVRQLYGGKDKDDKGSDKMKN